jgi:tripartite-type tricarboxylate transporter receptor subunit TctC
MTGLRLLTATALCLALSSVASAQEWPNRTVRIINPFPAGGAADVVSRALAQRLQEQLNQTFIVENRTGAGGNIGSDVVAKAPADGYTLLFGSDHLTISKALYPRLSYDTFTDLAPIVLVSTGPHVLLAHPSMPANSVRELIDLAKKDPGKYTYASAGTGTAQHLFGEMFKRAAGIDLVHVPYKGGAPAIVDLLGGQVNLGVIGLPPVVNHIATGKLKALAVTSSERTKLLPEVPTIGEALPGLTSVQWLGVFAPTGTSPATVDRLRSEISKALQHPDMKQRLSQIGAAPADLGPAEFTQFMKKDYAAWAKVIQETGIKVE